MTKEEILQKAQAENKGADKVMIAVQKEASLISRAVGLVACMLLNLIDQLYLKTDIIGSVCWILYGVIVSSSLWVYAVKLKRRWYWVAVVLTSAASILHAVLLFTELCHA